MASRYENMQPVKTSFRPGILYGRDLRTPPEGVIRFTFHQMSEKDRWDTLASEYLKDVTLWWMILDANPEILDPFDIRPGQVIRLPYVLA
ncbi:hypothetical protein FDA94_29200 [Herbidospora galbida]|uniref:LysM domain-containing protein n=1 Tax=Herbidospora galbida TaxID=2575442 RepID=A0A4V5UYI7_9ACTN|nr:hypothetical protein [Herbidospora galbida]TKK84693.1 hypothetical protein FDA94_29200 [Herbidospora galbida]